MPNWIPTLTSILLLGLLGWSATRPDVCEGMTLVFHNGSFPSCHVVTEFGLARFGSLEDCPNECDRQHYRALGAASRRRKMSGRGFSEIKGTENVNEANEQAVDEGYDKLNKAVHAFNSATALLEG